MHRLWPLILLLTLFSCQDHKKQQQLTEIDHLIGTTDSIKKVFEEVRNDSIMWYITQVMDVEFRIRRSYRSDTVTEVFAKRMNDYKRIRKKLKPVVKMNKQVQDGVQEELETLHQLKQDIQNGAGERDKYDEYLVFERKKVDQLHTVLREIISVQNKQIGIYNALHQELYDFSMSLTHVVP